MKIAYQEQTIQAIFQYLDENIVRKHANILIGMLERGEHIEENPEPQKEAKPEPDKK